MMLYVLSGSFRKGRIWVGEESKNYFSFGSYNIFTWQAHYKTI